MPLRFKAISFQTKVLVPVFLVMALLVAATLFVVNRRLTAQFDQGAEQALQTADAVFQYSQKDRTEALVLRFLNIARQSQYTAACFTEDTRTLNDFFSKKLLVDDADDAALGDLIQYVNTRGKVIATASRDPTIRAMEVGEKTRAVVARALEREAAAVDTIPLGDRLFDAVAVPVKMKLDDQDSKEQSIGALVFCSRLGDTEAEKFSKLTGSSIMLVANERVVAASMKRLDLRSQCVSLFGTVPGIPPAPARTPASARRELVLPEEHYQSQIGHFDSLSHDGSLGYVLLYSTDDARRELQATQRTLIAVGLFGILFGTLVVSVLVRKVTAPLRDLRTSAEAVGRGDFSRRVPVTSQDECGELASVFNHMTENLQASRNQLELTVTRLENTQAQLIQSEKLSAIGQFVAGVTHELNNPLTSLLGFSELLQQSPMDERQKRFVDRIAGSARRCQKIVQSLLSFARQHTAERKVTNLNEIVESVIEIMVYELRTSNVEVVNELDPTLPNVLVDAHQLQQVFLNLVNNARQAMEGQSSGRLRVRTESRHGTVFATFQDNGPGISEENLKKIFDPFFTTKEAGKGTGLGLSLCYGILQEHGGTIRVESKPGAGATFIIELPVHTGKAIAPQESPHNSAKVSGPAGEGRRVLVIDDEEAILDFVSEVLSADGFKVDTACDGDAALKRLRECHYDLALCDWKMPGLNGRHLFERVQQDDPAAARRFVFMTGDVINDQAENFLKKHSKVCLPKPFSIADFRSVLSCLA